jgi:hypothetical protein
MGHYGAKHDPELKAQVLADIRAHMSIYGSNEWDKVLDKYRTQVAERTLWRWIAQIRDGNKPLPPTANKVPPPVQEQIDAAVEDGANRARLALVKNIPAAPSPSYMAKAGVRAEHQIDFLTQVTKLMADGEMLRAYAVTDDAAAPGREKIKNPVVFANSITQRLRVMETAIKVMQEIWDLEAMQRFFDEITAIIVDEMAAFPELQVAVLKRLKALNDARGITPYAGMG